LPKKAPEDDVTCLAESADGALWFGTRKAGLLRLSRTSQSLTVVRGPLPDTYVSAILPLDDGQLLVGTYGYGAKRIVVQPIKEGTPSPSSKSALAQTDKAKVDGRGAAPNRSKSGGNGATPRPLATYLGEDWQTQGDWIGAYGRTAYILPAMGRPLDYLSGIGPTGVRYRAAIGPKHRKGDSLRYWTHWRKTDNPKSLQSPIQPHRTQASWDDAGETYPPTHGGPNVVVDLELPDGDFIVSLYVVNIDCIDCPKHWRTSDLLYFPNRFRDYLVEIRAATEVNAPQPEALAQARIRAFNSGVYKRFLLRGAHRYSITVRRQRSHNTILSGIFVDPVSAPPAALIVPDDLPAIPGLGVFLAKTAAAVSELAPLHAKVPDQYLLLARDRACELAQLLKQPREFLQSHPEVMPPPVLLDGMERLAHLLAGTGLSDTTAHTYRALGDLWVQHVARNPSPFDARAAFRDACSLVWTADHRPQLNHLRKPGWEPAPHAVAMFRKLAESYGPKDVMALSELAASYAGRGATLPIAAALLPRIEKLVGKTPMPPDALRAKGLCALRRGDHKSASACFRAAAAGYAGQDAKTDALQLAAYTAGQVARSPAEAAKVLQELQRLAPNAQATKDAARFVAFAGAKSATPPTKPAKSVHPPPVAKEPGAKRATKHTRTKAKSEDDQKEQRGK
ncbi:MAG: hypothetical protein HQ582_22675, partial [Planctomycetes bacterium]|nr:hypothetical protein [Planctomycetota bacterium]